MAGRRHDHVSPGSRVNFGWSSTGVLSDQRNQSCPGWQVGERVGLPAHTIMFCWGIGYTSAGFCSVSSQPMESGLSEQAGRVDAIMFMLRVNFSWRLPGISARKPVNFGWHSPGVSLAKGVKVAGVLLLLLFLL